MARAFKSSYRRSLLEVPPSWNRFSGGVTGVLVLCLWLAPPVLTVDAASPGTVVAWGWNNSGQTTVPAGLSGVTAMAAGYEHTVALKSNGTVVAWGGNYHGETTVPAGLNGVTAMAAGYYHTLALKSDGTVVAWGFNDFGQTSVPAGLGGVTAIAAGDSHTVALKSDGTVVAWGRNGEGQTTIPAGLGGVTAIAAGDYHTVALKSDSTVVAWGWNVHGQTTVPAGLNGVTAIAAGNGHTLALKSDGTVVAWGRNDEGQTTVPPGLSGVTAIAAGKYHTVALRSDGTVGAWGLNNFGQTTVPAGLSTVTAIAAGSSHTVAVAVVPPVITSPLFVTGTVGLPFVYQFEASGATSLGVSNLAPGLTFDPPSLRAITGLPTTAGVSQVGLSATNSAGTTNRMLTITVQPAPTPGLVIVSSTCATGRTGRAFSFQLQAIGGSSATRFAVDGLLPPGLNLDSSTGFISGIPTSDGSFGLAVSAIDGAATTNATLQLTFTSDPTVPIITSERTATLTPGQFFTYPITADANGTFGYIGSDGIVYQAPSPSCAGLPAGLCFDGDHTISGIFNPPFASDRGSSTRPDQTGGIITNVQLFAANPPNGASIIALFRLLDATGAQNIATRLSVGTDDNALIGGFIIDESFPGSGAPKKVVIRAKGPFLTQVGVPNALADPVLELIAQAGPLSSNDNWRDNQGQATQITATGLQPSDDREPAILAYLNPGPYTAVVRGKNNSTGNAIVEVYDLGTVLVADASNSRLANISTRGTVLGGDSVMIGGVIIGGADTRVVVRAIGPSLTAFGINGALQDPTVELRNADAMILIQNDDWEDNPAQAAEIQQRMLAPRNPRESALVATLKPGQYTAIVSGKGGATGVAVVEGYALSNP